MMRAPRQRSLLAAAIAPYGFVLVGFALGSGVVPVRYPGPLVAITLALALAAIVLGDFIAGETRWPVGLVGAGQHRTRVTLRGAAARLLTGRFLLVCIAAVGTALHEWRNRGWLADYLGGGSGAGAVIVLIGVFFAMGALAGLVHARARGVRALVLTMLLAQLAASASTVAIGLVEANERGTVASLVRSLSGD